MLPATPAQTVGPYFSIALAERPFDTLADPADPHALRLVGTVRDGDLAPVPDALVEIWQADPNGRFDHPGDTRTDPPIARGFRGFGRCATGPDGGYEFRTVKPGRVLAPNGQLQAPHIAVSLFARGLLQRLVTRVYFPEDERLNATDPILAAIADPKEHASLIAQPTATGVRFDIVLQGPEQTAFLAI